jgi:hypothetical protein
MNDGSLLWPTGRGPHVAVASLHGELREAMVVLKHWIRFGSGFRLIGTARI